MIDMAHFAGLVAGENIQVRCRGPILLQRQRIRLFADREGGIIMCKEEYAKAIDKAVFPAWWGPLEHVIAAKAVAFGEDPQSAFQRICEAGKENEKVLSDELQNRGIRVLWWHWIHMCCWRI